MSLTFDDGPTKLLKQPIKIVNHVEFGRASAYKLDDAKEQAAYIALRVHRGDDA